MSSTAAGDHDIENVDDASLPSAKECEERCNQFVEITNTNSVEAQMYLQEHGWSLDRSLQTYFEATGKHESPVKVDIMAAAKSGDASRIRVLSWNLDGLDDVGLVVRTNSALQTIKKEDPDVIFLQEVVACSWEIIKGVGSSYHIVPADLDCQYFTVVLLKKATVLLDSHLVKPFFSSMMMRKLQILEVNVKGINVRLMNTHLESTAAHSVERLRQLKLCFDEVTSADSKFNVIFGGDLNLGSKDTRGINVPSNVQDMWEALGSKNETRYTWDTKYNDNKQMSFGGRPRCRFDRIYFRPSSIRDVVPSNFNLAGIERVANCSRFPSDHWAIVCEFHIKCE